MPRGDETRPLDAQYVLIARSRPYGEREAPFRPGPRAEVHIDFSDPARLVVTIVGQAGSPYEGRLDVELVRPDDRVNPFWRDVRADRNRLRGVHTFENLEPGPWHIALLLRTGGRSARLVLRRPVEVRAGENALDLPIPKLHQVTVRLAENVRGKVWLQEVGERGGVTVIRDVEPADKGRVVLEEIPAGRYRVTCYGGMTGPGKEIDVPDVTEVSLP